MLTSITETNGKRRDDEGLRADLHAHEARPFFDRSDGFIIRFLFHDLGFVRADRAVTSKLQAQAHVQHTHNQIFTHFGCFKPFKSCSDCTAGCLHWLCDFLTLFFTSFKSSISAFWKTSNLNCSDAKQRREGRLMSWAEMQQLPTAYVTCVELDMVKKAGVLIKTAQKTFV